MIVNVAWSNLLMQLIMWGEDNFHLITSRLIEFNWLSFEPITSNYLRITVANKQHCSSKRRQLV